MRLLLVDIGAFTQDILLFDSSLAVENCPQFILPSPTVLVARKIQEATRKRQTIAFTGTIMGGGPNHSALREHLGAGRGVFATAQAARTFDDDLELVASWGVRIVSEEEALKMRGAVKIELKDLDLAPVRAALGALGLEAGFEGLGVAVLDHGAAPAGVSDRHFRFQHLKGRVEANPSLPALAYLAPELPPSLTRMKAVAGSLEEDVPLLLMDTGPAAALGAGEDREVARHPYRLCLNLGNAHTVGVLLHGEEVLALFEHHTRMLTAGKLAQLVEAMVAGRLRHEDVWEAGGHGALFRRRRRGQPFLVATGPRRGMLRGSSLGVYLAAPYGSMMLTGCFGLLRALAYRVEAFREEIEKALAG